MSIFEKYSSKINSGTTYVNVYDRNKVSEEIPNLVGKSKT